MKLGFGLAVCASGFLLWTSFAAPLKAGNAPVLNEPCAATADLRLNDLERQRLTLERAIADGKLQNEALASTAEDSEPAKRTKQQLESDQEQLIDVLYRIECFRPDLENADDILRGSPASLTMSLFYATNRRPIEGKQIDNFYGADDAKALAYGITTISIPSLHKPGELELPSLWKLEWNANPDRHFQVKAVTPLDSMDARAQIAATLSKERSKSLLIFVHGYNASFLEASYRTAQLAYDLRFPGLAMFFSWPSAGSTAGYLHDEESAHLAIKIFDQLLDDLSAQQFENIYVIAHSMGNRVVGEALAERVKGQKDVSKLREIMLAAPDINVEIFRSEIAPRLASLQSARKTIYASSNDLALKASNVIHGFPRVGDTRAGVFIYPGFDTIDASAAAPLARSFGHSYVLDSTVVLNDVEDVIMWRKPASDRTLRSLGLAPDQYWGLR